MEAAGREEQDGKAQESNRWKRAPIDHAEACGGLRHRDSPWILASSGLGDCIEDDAGIKRVINRDVPGLERGEATMLQLIGEIIFLIGGLGLQFAGKKCCNASPASSTCCHSLLRS